jgi:hypothetical protein
MSHELFNRLHGQMLDDAVRSHPVAGSGPIYDLKRKSGVMANRAPASEGDDMDTRLRSIRRYITPRELAALLHWHPETIYHKIKAGMPADRLFDSLGRVRQLKIYPPQIADWMRDCREARKRGEYPPSSVPIRNRGDSNNGQVVESTK